MEMVIAIAILGLIMTGLIVTTTQTIVTYQATDARVAESSDHTMAALRAERIAARVWRDPDPPAGHADLIAAKADELRVGDWRLRANSDVLEQVHVAPPYELLVDDVSGFAFSYRLSGGGWISQTLNPGERSTVVAVKYQWTDAVDGRIFGGISVLPDRQFSTGFLGLRTPTPGGAYNRSDHEQQITLNLGTWP